jgi:hypothetical protein
MDGDFMKPIEEAGIPIFGDLDAKLRDDVRGEFLAECLDVLHSVRAELINPVCTDAAFRHESNLTSGALRAADQVLRSMWASFHPGSVSYRQSTSC